MPKRKRKKRVTKHPQKHEQMPEKIPDTPENIMRALCSMPKDHEWEYLESSK